jgi:hypothetical protein
MRPAPPGTAPGKVVVVWVLSAQLALAPAQPRAGTLPGKIELSPDFHMPLNDFQPSGVPLNRSGLKGRKNPALG